MVSLLFIALAAISKAIADTIKHHPDTSIFKNRVFWIGEGKYFPFTKYKVDGWHICNSIMIGFFVCLKYTKSLYSIPIDFVILITLFILIFNLFYNKILR